MNWLALSPLQVLAFWAAAATLAVWLYLHVRRPVRRRVSTLRFWVSVQPVSQPRRKRLREPWALLAQLLFLLLLIAALANPYLGTPFEGRSVAIVLDTSIWAQARPQGQTPWMDRIRQQALQLLDSLPSSNRVLLLSAEAGAPPIAPFTTDRAALRRAVTQTRASSGVADVPRALEMARSAVAGSPNSLLAYVGPGMLDDAQLGKLAAFRQELESASGTIATPEFVVRLARAEQPIENHGITRLSLQRDAAQPDRWHLLTQLKNYSDDRAPLTLKLSVDGRMFGQRTLTLQPGQLTNEESTFISSQGGLLRAEISPADDLSADDRAVITLPAFQPVQVAVFTMYSPFANNLLNALSSNPYLRTEVVVPGSGPVQAPDVSIYQGVSQPPKTDSNAIIFLTGQASKPPVTVRVTDWNTQHPVTRWVHTHDISVRNPAPLTVEPGDVVLASGEGNPPVPLMLARERNGHRLLIVGFDPHNSNLPLQSAFPLLMAAGMEWMTHSVVEQAESLSVGELDLSGPAVRIISPSGRDVPFAQRGSDVHLLAGETGLYRFIAPNGETSVAVNTPLLPSRLWEPTSQEAAAVRSLPLEQAGSDLWRWLTVLALIALWLEWMFYYFRREQRHAAELRNLPGSGEWIDLDPDLPHEAEKSQSRDPNLVT